MATSIPTNYQGTLTFSTTDPDPGVVLPANYTFTAADAGIHTFVGGFILITVGDQTLTATDRADVTITGSATVQVNPGPAAPPEGGGTWPFIPSTNAGIAPTRSMQPGRTVAAVDQVFALVSVEGSAAFESNP